MDKFIEGILKLLPFSTWLVQAGLSKEINAGLSVVFVAGLLRPFFNPLKIAA